MSEVWDGKERRKVDLEIRDMIIETRNDVKHMVSWAKEHNEDDNRRFALVTKEIEVGKKVLWGGVGVLAAVEFIMKLIK